MTKTVYQDLNESLLKEILDLKPWYIKVDF